MQKGGEKLGYESEAFAIYDTMKYIKPSVRTLCVGTAFGESAMLLAAGEKVVNCSSASDPHFMLAITCLEDSLKHKLLHLHCVTCTELTGYCHRAQLSCGPWRCCIALLQCVSGFIPSCSSKMLYTPCQLALDLSGVCD